ncbi:hypothetical protein BA065_01665 [Nanoarchaeota archaeon NZ13-N]|nr:MAG: hypothetical protein BA065_01665 [Nanoarchaeota archaeon NZ13-N]
MSLDNYLNVEIINIAPKYKRYDYDIITSIAAMTTESSRDFIGKLEKAEKENKFELYKDLVKNSIERGYASITTTPTVYLNIVGTRISDLFFTAIPFSSALVLSQRVVKPDRYYVPKEIGEVKLLDELLEFYWELVNRGIRPEVARRILPLSTPSHIFLQLPLESLSVINKYISIYQEYIPTEIETILNKIKESLKSDFLDAILNSPQFNFDIRSVFKPYESIEHGELKILKEDSYELNEFLDNIESLLNKLWKNRDRKLAWEVQQKIAENGFRYSLVLSFPCSIACYNELKRHRTIYIHPESIYSSIERAHKDYKNIYIPPEIKNREDLLERYLNLTYSAIEEYQRVKEKYGERFAVYLIPQNIIIRTIIKIDLNNLLNFFSFYRIRSCYTAEFEIREKVREIPNLIKNKKLRDLLIKDNLPLSKCIIGYCPEPENRRCNIYKKLFNKE